MQAAEIVESTLMVAGVETEPENGGEEETK